MPATNQPIGKSLSPNLRPPRLDSNRSRTSAIRRLLPMDFSISYFPEKCCKEQADVVDQGLPIDSTAEQPMYAR
jgi:hypothetical protein